MSKCFCTLKDSVTVKLGDVSSKDLLGFYTLKVSTTIMYRVFLIMPPSFRTSKKLNLPLLLRMAG